MNEVLANFKELKRQDDAKLSSLLAEQQDEIIESFGGLTNIIELCLTHPNASKYFDTECKQFDRFKQLMEHQTNVQKNTTIVDDDEDLKIHDNVAISKQAPSEQQTFIVNANKSIETNIDSFSSDHQHTVDTLSDYFQFKLVVDCKTADCLCYKIFDDKNKCDLLYNLILNKCVFCAVCCIGLCTFLVYSVYYYFTGSEMSRIWSLFPTIVILLYGHGLSLLLTLNITVIHMIINTFDFWFKIYNTMVLFGSLWIRSYYDDEGRYSSNKLNSFNQSEIASEIIIQITIIGIVIGLFLLDSINLSNNVKRFSIIICIACIIFHAIYLYFFEQDYEWNPFKFQFTKISFKSVLLSSYVNLILFISKPICSDIIRWLRKRKRTCCKPNTNNTYNAVAMDNINTNQCIKMLQRSSTVYKRPYLQWNMTNKKSSSNGNDVK